MRTSGYLMMAVAVLGITGCKKSKRTDKPAAPVASPTASPAVGATAASASPVAGNATATAAVAAPLTGCPDDAKLAEIIGAAHGVPVGTEVVNTTCVAGKFMGGAIIVGTALVFVDGEAHDNWAAIDPAGKVTWKHTDDVPPSFADQGSTALVGAADFDGDGVDEVLINASDDRHGYLSHVANLVKLGGTDLTSLLATTYAFETAGAVETEAEEVSCDGSAAIEKDATGKPVLVVTTTNSKRGKKASKSDAENCKDGVSRFTWQGGKLALTK